MRRPDLARTMVCAAAMALLAGCQEYWASSPEPPPGDAETGAALIQTHGCGSCHVIPGIPGASGLVGPSLAQIRLRGYIAGVLPNTPDNMAHWLLNPQAVDHRTAMPNQGLTALEAMDITAYLYTLE